MSVNCVGCCVMFVVVTRCRVVVLLSQLMSCDESIRQLMSCTDCVSQLMSCAD